MGILRNFLVYAGLKRSTEYDHTKAKKAEAYLRSVESCAKGQVVFAGDSIIELFQLDKFFATEERAFYNRGISGDTADKLLERIPAVAALEPETAVLLIGTNDLYFKRTPQEIVKDLKGCGKRLKEAGAKNLLILSLCPVNRSISPHVVRWRKNEDILTCNALLEEMCAREGLIYVNIHDELTDDKGCFERSLTPDGLHPNFEGYKKIANVIKNRLTDISR